MNGTRWEMGEGRWEITCDCTIEAESGWYAHLIQT